MDEHLSEVALSLKQVDVCSLDELALYALSATLHAYGLKQEPEQIERGKSNLRDTFQQANLTVEFDPTTSRRFAGDRTLPRSCYYSIRNDSPLAGSDGSTLIQEICAYLIGSQYPGLVSIFENLGIIAGELLTTLASISKKNMDALSLNEPSLLIALRPLARDEFLRSAYGNAKNYLVQIPYVLTEETVQDVLDLRRPEAQSWVVDQFKRSFSLGDKEFPVLLQREPPANFAQLLPSLIDQSLGGGWGTGNMVGHFVRQAGAAGLVYPSARTNAWVEVEDNVVKRSNGWCFVRYAGAGPMEINLTVGIDSGEWPATAGYSSNPYTCWEEFIPAKGTRIEFQRSEPLAGSFAVLGLGEYNHAIYRLIQARSVLKAIDMEHGSMVGGKLASLGLFSAPEDIKWLAEVVLGALLGHRTSMASLKSAIESAASEYERETLKETLALVARVPPTFQERGRKKR